MRRNGASTTGLLRLMEKRNRPRSLLALATKQREDAPAQEVERVTWQWLQDDRGGHDVWWRRPFVVVVPGDDVPF